MANTPLGNVLGGVMGVWVGFILASLTRWLRRRKRTRIAVDTRSCPQCYAHAGYWCKGLSGRSIHDGRRF